MVESRSGPDARGRRGAGGRVRCNAAPVPWWIGVLMLSTGVSASAQRFGPPTGTVYLAGGDFADPAIV